MEEKEGKGEKTYVPGDVTLVTSEGNEAFDGIGFEWNGLEIRSIDGSNMGSVPLSLKFLAPFREGRGKSSTDRDRDEESINQTVAASRDRSPAHGFAASPALMNEN